MPIPRTPTSVRPTPTLSTDLSSHPLFDIDVLDLLDEDFDDYMTDPTEHTATGGAADPSTEAADGEFPEFSNLTPEEMRRAAEELEAVNTLPAHHNPTGAASYHQGPSYGLQDRSHPSPIPRTRPSAIPAARTAEPMNGAGPMTPAAAPTAAPTTVAALTTTAMPTDLRDLIQSLFTGMETRLTDRIITIEQNQGVQYPMQTTLHGLNRTPNGTMRTPPPARIDRQHRFPLTTDPLPNAFTRLNPGDLTAAVRRQQLAPPTTGPATNPTLLSTAAAPLTNPLSLNADIATRLRVPLPSAAKSKTPPPITDDVILKAATSANRRDFLIGYLSNIERHIRRCSHGQLRLSELLDHFEGECYVWVRDYINGLDEHTAYADDAGPAAITALTDAFLQYATGEVRTDAAIALDKLLKGEITQKSDHAGAYAQRFTVVAKTATGVEFPNLFTQAMLCARYLAGLNIDLRAKCAVDDYGEEWTSLTDLTRFSYREERRLLAAAAILKASHPLTNTDTPSHSPKAWQTVGQPLKPNDPGNPRPVAPAAPSAPTAPSAPRTAALAAAANTPSRRSSRPPSRHSPLTRNEMPGVGQTDATWEDLIFMPKDVNSSADFKSAIARLPYRLRPVSEAPFELGFHGRYKEAATNPELSRKLQLCRAWWICGFCRRGRHAWDDCEERRQSELKRGNDGAGPSQPRKRAA